MFLKAYPADLRPFAFKMLSYQLITGLTLFNPIYMLYLADLGFKPSLAMGLLSLWYVVGFLFELPSSVWADRYSRKKMVIVGEVASAIGYVCFWMSPNVWGVTLGFIIWGLRGALVTGTLEAYLYDELKHHNQTAQFTMLQGHRSAVTWVGILLSGLGVVAYKNYGIELVIILSIFSRILGTIIVAQWPEESIAQHINSKTKNIKTHMLAAKDVLKNDKWLIVVMLLTACMTNITLLRNILTTIGDELHMTGWQGTWGFMLASSFFIFGSLLARYVPLERLNKFLWFALLPCVLVLFSPFAKGVWGYFLLISYVFFVYQIWAVHSMTQRQERVPSHLRATVISVGGVFDRAIGVLSLNILGVLATKTSYHYAAQSLVWPALVVLGVVGVYGVWVRLRSIKT